MADGTAGRAAPASDSTAVRSDEWPHEARPATPSSQLDYLVAARPQRAGLANRLFPWARAVVHSTLAEAPMLQTRWMQLKLGPVLRGERDTRLYGGLFEREPWAVARPLGDRVRPRRHLPEPARLDGRSEQHGNSRTLVVFTGLSDYFERLIDHRFLVRERLGMITKLESRSDRPAVVAHARRADFPARFRTPDEWYLAALRFLRSCGYEGDVGLVSDGTDADLRPLYEAGFTPVRGRNAIDDLWTLAGAAVVLASGVSTFSSWATYLGDGVTLTPDHLDCTGLDRLLPARVRRIGVSHRPHDTAHVVMKQLARR